MSIGCGAATNDEITTTMPLDMPTSLIITLDSFATQTESSTHYWRVVAPTSTSSSRMARWRGCNMRPTCFPNYPKTKGRIETMPAIEEFKQKARRSTRAKDMELRDHFAVAAMAALI